MNMEVALIPSLTLSSSEPGLTTGRMGPWNLPFRCAEWRDHHASIAQAGSRAGLEGPDWESPHQPLGEGRGASLGSQTPENREGGGGENPHLDRGKGATDV